MGPWIRFVADADYAISYLRYKIFFIGVEVDTCGAVRIDLNPNVKEYLFWISYHYANNSQTDSEKVLVSSSRGKNTCKRFNC